MELAGLSCEIGHVRFSKHNPRAFVRCLALVVALGMSGGQWMILQSVAWAKMIVDYSRHANLQTAIEQTFDGKHPCAMCRLIEAGRQSSQPAQHEIRTTRTPDNDVLFATILVVDCDLPDACAVAAVASSHPTRSDPPPVPPPRMPSCQA